jgi:Cd2+/Zn2+-exporting ATPase
VVGIAVATAVIPSVVSGNWSYWVYTALTFLVMSCPCALVLSVPLAFFSGIGAGSRRGILFKGGVSMEAMAGVKAVVLDKTGTLTRGDFRVQEIAGDEEMLRLCAAAEQRSTHPIARSIVSRAGDMVLPTPENLEEIAGQGICATIEGKIVLCGNARLMRAHNISFEEVSNAASTVVYVAADGKFLGYLLISDTIKDGAAEAVAQLKRRGIATAMLTGDSEPTALAVAMATGVEEVHAKLLPHQKLEELQRIRAEKGAVMFVGDGINDAPVLAGADVGAAMGSGADAAIEAADVVFMTSAPEAIPEALSIAERTKAIAWQNVTFALAIKAVVMALGLLGYASMWLAVFADSGVAMLCVLNSIRLLYRRKQ